MKTKVIIIVLLVIAVGLCIGLITIKQQADSQHQTDADAMATVSNNLTKAAADVQDREVVISNLNKDLDTRKEEGIKLSNDLAQASDSLTKTQADLKNQKDETAKRDAKISQLEAENASLDKKATDLQATIDNLQTKIDDTQKKLAASEGDKVFLTKELNRLMAQKEDLEKQFNDVAALKAQLGKIRAENYAAQRSKWQREGVYARENEKGAQRLMQGAGSQPAVAAAHQTNAADLSVEINSDGSVKIISPITNAPAGK